MSYIGTTEIGKMFLGDVEIDKAYLGDDLVFSGTHVPQQYTLTKYPSSYVAADSSYSSISGASRAYTSATSTTYCQITMNTDAGSASYIYFKFDASSIPANATIDSVSCVVKTQVSQPTSNVPTANIGLYTGTTLKGSTVSVPGNSARTDTISGATWTREELSDIRVRFYTKRKSSYSAAANMRFYGATLTITYTA